MANEKTSKIVISKSFLMTIKKRELYFWSGLIADNPSTFDYSKTKKQALVNFILTFARHHKPQQITINELMMMPYKFLWNLNNYLMPTCLNIYYPAQKRLLVENVYNLLNKRLLEVK